MFGDACLHEKTSSRAIDSYPKGIYRHFLKNVISLDQMVCEVFYFFRLFRTSEKAAFASKSGFSPKIYNSRFPNENGKGKKNATNPQDAAGKGGTGETTALPGIGRCAPRAGGRQAGHCLPCRRGPSGCPWARGWPFCWFCCLACLSSVWISVARVCSHSPFWIRKPTLISFSLHIQISIQIFLNSILKLL